MNVRPAERANHGRRAPGFQAERDARAKKAQERCDGADVSAMKPGELGQDLLRPAAGEAQKTQFLGEDDAHGRANAAGAGMRRSGDADTGGFLLG